ncbi:MAG: hypothetical protein EBY29_07450 [Planctomycetes bacterium]|nr:hypothetical protein [Planctomycetota bacterium]
MSIKSDYTSEQVALISSTEQSKTRHSPSHLNIPSRAFKSAWTIAALLFAFLTIYPIFGGIVVTNDDLKFVRGEDAVGSLSDIVRSAWLHSKSFRPLELLVASMCDAVTLECWFVVPIQLLGLLTVAGGIVAMCKRVLHHSPIAAPLILIWVFLSPSTMSSLWQMDTCSQTWSAALGLWCAILTWDVFIAVQRGEKIWKEMLVLFVIAALGMNIKETFYGWICGITLGWTIASVVCWRKDFRPSLRAALPLIPIVIIPLIAVVLRYKFGGLGAQTNLDGDITGRYQFSLGENLLINASVSMFGIFINGPIHLFTDEAASLFLRAICPLSGLAAGILLLSAIALRILHGKSNQEIALSPILLAVGVCICSLLATLALGTVSDMYGFGANIGSGILLVTSILILWDPIDGGDQKMFRALVYCAAVTLCLTGVYGIASRTYQFSMTWQYTRTLNEMVLAHIASLPPVAPDAQPVIFYFTDSCCTGHTFGQIMIPLNQSMGTESVEVWLNRNYPKQKILFVIGRPLVIREGIDLVVDCDTLPRRGDW